MGDFNAKMGSDNQGYEKVMGEHGLGVMNDNFIAMCACLCNKQYCDWGKRVHTKKNT